MESHNSNSECSTNNDNRLNELGGALAKAQSEFKPPLKKCKVDFTNNKGQRVKYSYADLADVLEALKIPLSKNNLSVAHILEYTQAGYGLRTILMHSSGQRLSTFYPLPDPMKGEIRAQEFGSALTYARRYSISAICGIASDEDDDGGSAPATKPPTKAQAQTKNSPPKGQPQDNAGPKKNHAPASAEMLANLSSFMEARGITNEILEYVVRQGYQYQSHLIPTFMALEILEVLSDESCTEATMIAFAERMKNQKSASKMDAEKDPGEHIISFGEQVKGKKINEISEQKLKDMVLWARGELSKNPLPRHAPDIAVFQTQATAFLKSVGVEV